MKLTLDRTEYEKGATVGQLYINGEFECFTLEDEVVKVKVPGESAIPVGTYEIIITPSPKFKRRLPLLLDVPGFDGIRIHPGNTAADTEGCLLVGEKVIRNHGMPFLTNSRIAFYRLFERLDAAPERITIEVLE